MKKAVRRIVCEGDEVEATEQWQRELERWEGKMYEDGEMWPTGESEYYLGRMPSVERMRKEGVTMTKNNCPSKNLDMAAVV